MRDNTHTKRPLSIDQTRQTHLWHLHTKGRRNTDTHMLKMMCVFVFSLPKGQGGFMGE